VFLIGNSVSGFGFEIINSSLSLSVICRFFCLIDIKKPPNRVVSAVEEEKF
jgi:hypothetical protein